MGMVLKTVSDASGQCSSGTSTMASQGAVGLGTMVPPSQSNAPWKPSLCSELHCPKRLRTNYSMGCFECESEDLNMIRGDQRRFWFHSGGLRFCFAPILCFAMLWDSIFAMLLVRPFCIAFGNPYAKF